MRTQRVLVVVVILVAVVSAFALRVQNTGQKPTAANRILIVRLYGSIAEAGSGVLSADGTITPRAVAEHLRRAASDPSVKAVVLRISSPGGSIGASQEIYNMIRRFEKPIVVSMGDTAASGGYYIAAAADGIVANPGTLTGSIGVITALTRLDGLYDKLGIEVEIIKSGQHKDMFQRPLTPEERELLQQLNDEAWNQFVQAVAEGRSLDPEYVRTLATGMVFTGSQALELGLVDRLGDLEEAVQFAAELAGVEDPVPVEARTPQPWEQLFALWSRLIAGRRGPADLIPLEVLESLDTVPVPQYRLE